jgi:excisionase family DNA binding protein
MESEHAIFDVGEVAAYLKVQEQTVYAWRARGRGPRAVKLNGRALRWRKADVDAWLAEQLEPARVPVSA